MTTTDKRKRSLYFPDNILREMQSEAKRQERSLSWIVQYAWRIARSELMRLPSVGSSGFHAEKKVIKVMKLTRMIMQLHIIHTIVLVIEAFHTTVGRKAFRLF